MKVEEVIKVLTEFNKWRRGEPPYEWNDDPAKQMELQYSAKDIGVVIDEAIYMLKHVDMTERENNRERKYEYSEKYKDGEMDILHYESLKEARSLKFSKDSTIVRREVGEWQEVQNV